MIDVPCDETALKDELEADEGRRHKRYRCSTGHWTIGVGHNLEVVAPFSAEVWAQIVALYPSVQSQLLDDDVYLPDDIIDQVLGEDICIAVASLDAIWIGWRSLSELRKRALVNLVFQMGQTKLLEFVRFWRALRQYRFDRAALELVYTDVQRGIATPWYQQTQSSRKERVVAQIRDG